MAPCQVLVFAESVSPSVKWEPITSRPQVCGGQHVSPAQRLAHSGPQKTVTTPSSSPWVSGGGRGACCFNLCKYTAGGGREGNKKEPRFWITQSASGTDGAGRLNGPMAGCADSKPAPASGCRLVGGDSQRHAPRAEPGGCRAATSEVGAGRARVSETEPQVAAGAGLGQSSGGECCLRDPPNPLAHAAPHAHRAQ